MLNVRFSGRAPLRQVKRGVTQREQPLRNVRISPPAEPAASAAAELLPRHPR